MTGEERPEAMTENEWRAHQKNADEQLSESFPIHMTVASRETLRTKTCGAGVSKAEYIRRYVFSVPNPSPCFVGNSEIIRRGAV